MGGFDEFSDQGGDDQITLISVPMRVRSFAGQPWHFRTIAKGTHLFNSLVPATALDDKYTLVSPPVLNLLHQQAAYAEARIAAGESHDMSSGDYATLRRPRRGRRQSLPKCGATLASQSSRRRATSMPASQVLNC